MSGKKSLTLPIDMRECIVIQQKRSEICMCMPDRLESSPTTYLYLFTSSTALALNLGYLWKNQNELRAGAINCN